MKSITMITTSGIIAALALWAFPTVAQQYIAEQLLEEKTSEKPHQTHDRRDQARQKKSSETSRNEGFRIDPRLTPEYWGIDADTII